jgi:hypothetical protein
MKDSSCHYAKKKFSNCSWVDFSVTSLNPSILKCFLFMTVVFSCRWAPWSASDHRAGERLTWPHLDWGVGFFLFYINNELSKTKCLPCRLIHSSRLLSNEEAFCDPGRWTRSALACPGQWHTKRHQSCTFQVRLSPSKKMGFPHVFPLQCWVGFCFHFNSARKFRIGYLIQNIITFWYYIDNDMLQEKWIFHLGARTLVERLTFISSPIAINSGKLWLRMQLFAPDDLATWTGKPPFTKTRLDFMKRYGKGHKTSLRVSWKNWKNKGEPFLDWTPLLTGSLLTIKFKKWLAVTNFYGSKNSIFYFIFFIEDTFQGRFQVFRFR